MAVPYAISGVTGDGTELNPYQVTNMTQLFECCAVTDAYILLVNDIRCSRDSIYRNIVNKTLVINCAKLYSTGTRKVIYGWSCEPELITDDSIKTMCCIRNTAQNTIINNISFTGCIIKSPNTVGIGTAYESLFVFSQTCNIENCNFSFFIDYTYDSSVTTDNAISYIYGGNFKESYIYITASLPQKGIGGYGDLGFKPTSADRCFVYCDGLYFATSQNGYSIFENFSNSTIICENIYFRIYGSYNGNEMNLFTYNSSRCVWSFDGDAYGSMYDKIHHYSNDPQALYINITTHFSDPNVWNYSRLGTCVVESKDLLKNPDVLKSCGIIV